MTIKEILTKLKAGYEKISGKKALDDKNMVHPKFMFFVVENYESIIKFNKKQFDKIKKDLKDE